MKLRDLSKEEIELLSYTDLTEIILKESKKPISTALIFKEICSLLDYSDSLYEEKIGDYYTSLTIDKRFILLDTAEWDLKERHKVKIVLDDDDIEDYEIEEVEEEDLDEEEDDIEEIDTIIDDDDDIEDEDLEDLNIIEEEDLENE